MGRRVDGRRARDLHDMAWASLQESIGCHLPALMVVGTDDGNLVAEETVKGDDGQIDFLIVLEMEGMGTDDQAIHRVAAQHVEEGELGVLFLSRRADHRFVATVVERNLDLVQQGRKEGMSDVWDDDADEVRAVEREIAPNLARHVVKRSDGLLDFLLREF